MKLITFIFSFLLNIHILNAQTNIEYVTNGSFEIIDSCYRNPSSIGDDVFSIIGCSGWSNPIASSSDHWCENPQTSPPFIGDPGFSQYPRTGNAMVGILVNDGIVLNYREYIQNKLSQPLIPNNVYEISFYVAATNTECSLSEFGIKFFTYQFNDNTKLWLSDLVPDAVNDHNLFVPDTLNWQKITMQYKANGTEQYMILGNFEDSAKIKYSLPCDSTYWTTDWRGIGNYFYIDDVSVQEIKPNVFIPNVFTPNGDGFNDFFVISALNIGNWKCDIYNRWGSIIETLNNNYTKWDGANCSNGTYYYVFTSETINKTGFLSILK